jgi:hypothetical protein
MPLQWVTRLGNVTIERRWIPVSKDILVECLNIEEVGLPPDRFWVKEGVAGTYRICR